MIRFIPPANTPSAVTLVEAKLQMRVEIPDEDALIAGMIAAATSAAEHETGCALVSQEWLCLADSFPQGDIQLKMPPIITIASLQYRRDDGELIVLDPTQYTCTRDGLLSPVSGSWPAGGDVVIKYQAGFGEVGDVPGSIKQWILLHATATFVHRESVQPGNLVEMPYVKHLLDRYRIWNVI